MGHKPIPTIFWEEKEKHLVFGAKNDKLSVITCCNNTYQAKLVNHGTGAIWVGLKVGHPVGIFWMLNLKTKQINLTHDEFFLNKSCNEWNKVNDPFNEPISYEESDDEDDDDSILENNNITSNNYNVVSIDSENKSKEEKVFEQDIRAENEVSSNKTLNPRVVQAIKNLQASYKKDDNRIVEQAKQDKAELENSSFLINLASIAMVAEDKVITKK